MYLAHNRLEKDLPCVFAFEPKLSQLLLFRLVNLLPLLVLLLLQREYFLSRGFFERFGNMIVFVQILVIASVRFGGHSDNAGHIRSLREARRSLRVLGTGRGRCRHRDSERRAARWYLAERDCLRQTGQSETVPVGCLWLVQRTKLIPASQDTNELSSVAQCHHEFF